MQIAMHLWILSAETEAHWTNIRDPRTVSHKSKDSMVPSVFTVHADRSSLRMKPEIQALHQAARSLHRRIGPFVNIKNIFTEGVQIQAGMETHTDIRIQ